MLMFISRTFVVDTTPHLCLTRYDAIIRVQDARPTVTTSTRFIGYRHVIRVQFVTVFNDVRGVIWMLDPSTNGTDVVNIMLFKGNSSRLQRVIEKIQINKEGADGTGRDFGK